jgi:hypothetical protein
LFSCSNAIAEVPRRDATPIACWQRFSVFVLGGIPNLTTVHEPGGWVGGDELCSWVFFLFDKGRSRFSQCGNVRAHQRWVPMDLTFDVVSKSMCMVPSARRDSPHLSAHQQDLHLNVILTNHGRGSLCGTTISGGTNWARLKMLQRVTSAIICNDTHKTSLHDLRSG